MASWPYPPPACQWYHPECSAIRGSPPPDKESCSAARAHSLRLRAVAEGAETAGQMEALTDLAPGAQRLRGSSPTSPTVQLARSDDLIQTSGLCSSYGDQAISRRKTDMARKPRSRRWSRASLRVSSSRRGTVFASPESFFSDTLKAPSARRYTAGKSTDKGARLPGSRTVRVRGQLAVAL
jgi:hypothetical protein